MDDLCTHSAVLTDSSPFQNPHKLASDAHDILSCLIQVWYFHIFLLELRSVRLELTQTCFHYEVTDILGFALNCQ